MHAALAREAAPNSLTPNGTKGVGVISPNMYTRTPRWMNTAAVHSCDMPSGNRLRGEIGSTANAYCKIFRVVSAIITNDDTLFRDTLRLEIAAK
jgi:hypothetical protein